MGPGRDRTCDPWNCSQTRICSQTRYRLRYAARYISRWQVITSRHWVIRIYKCILRIFFYLFQVFREIKVKNFDFGKFTTKQVFFPSKDGTKVPMFIVHRKVSLIRVIPGKSVTGRWKATLTLCILMNSSFWFDTINLGYSVVHI